jgi:hypothetical protein
LFAQRRLGGGERDIYIRKKRRALSASLDAIFLLKNIFEDCQNKRKRLRLSASLEFH